MDATSVENKCSSKDLDDALREYCIFLDKEDR